MLTLVDVKCNHFDKRYELQMSLQQTSILLLFNNVDRMNLEEISNQSNISGSELERNLKALFELGILERSGEGNNSLIHLNTNFTR